MLLLGMFPWHVQLPGRLRALLRMQCANALHLQLRHLLLRVASWRELELHAL